MKLDFTPQKSFACYFTLANIAVAEVTTGSFSNDDGDSNENGKKTTGLISKNNNFTRASSRASSCIITCIIVHHHHVHFLYISLPSLHDYDVKMHHFTINGNVNKRRRSFLSLSELESGRQEINS